MGLDITVQDLSVVDMLYSEAHLSEVIQQLILCEVVFVSALVFLCACLYLLVDIATICVVHHDTQLPFFGFVYFSEPADIWVVQNLQYLCLVQGLTSFLLAHLGDVDLLDDGQGLVRLALDQVGSAEGPNAQGRHFFVCFKSLSRFLLI